MQEKLRVLIVDDEPRSAAMIKSLLEKNFPAMEVAGIASAIQQAIELQSQQIDLVFLDAVLKGESGFDLLDKTPQRTWSFILLSASRDHAFKAFEYGASGYLLKPVNREELLAALSNLFHQKPLIGN